jgi:hypothetical protein
LALENTSAIVRGCEAMFNRTDGLNIHGTGIADFIDCRSHDNGDDGISHHDKSSGTVIGGEYYGNGKGGVCSPTFGSRNSINGVNVHDNGVGVYAVADGTEVDGHPECNVSNCVIRNNGVGIKTQYYKFVCWGNVLEGNDTDVVEEYGGIVEIVRDSIPAPATAQVGQTIVVKEVDESGKPVSWECVDLPAGGSGGEQWELIAEKYTVEEEVASVTFNTDVNGNAFSLKKMRIFMYLPSTTDSSIYADYRINGKGYYTSPSGGWSDKNLMCDIETTGAANTADIRWYVLGAAPQSATTERVHIVWKMDGLDTIRSFKWALFNKNVMPNTTFEVWGVRA